MKVAICVSGHVRDYESFLPGLKKLKDHFNADLFIHSYKLRGNDIRFAFGGETQSEKIDYNKIVGILDPKLYEFTEELEPFDFLKGRFYAEQKMFLTEPHYKMIYKMWCCNELKKQYENENNFKYDLVIRTRFDLSYKEYNLSNPNPNKILFAAKADDKRFMTDTCFACSSENMDKMMEIKEHYGKDKIKVEDYLNCEDIFTQWAHRNGIEVSYGKLYTVLRDKHFNY